MWPSAPVDTVGGNPDEVQLIVMELGALAYRVSERAHATGDERLRRLAPLLWLPLVAERLESGRKGDRDAFEKAFIDITTFLQAHTPENFRTDHIAIDAVFSIEEMRRVRETTGVAKQMSPIAPPVWFPGFSPESIARGLMVVAQRALDDFLSPNEREALRLQKPLTDGSCAKIADVLLRYLTWCLPGPTFPDVATLQLALRRIGEAKAMAKLAMRLWLSAAPESWSDDKKREQEVFAKDLVDNLFDERLRKQEERAVEEATDAEVQPYIDEFKKSFVLGGAVVPPLLRQARWFIATHTTPNDIGETFARRLIPEQALGDHQRHSLLERVRRNVASRVSMAIVTEKPVTPAQLSEVICGAIGVPLRQLCHTDRLRELLQPLGIEMHHDPNVDPPDRDYFDDWHRHAFTEERP